MSAGRAVGRGRSPSGSSGGGACSPDFERTLTRAVFVGIDPDSEGVGAPGTIVGVVPDDVVAVDITVGGTHHPATLDRNGFFYELPDGDCTNAAFESLTLTFQDQSSDIVPLRWHKERNFASIAEDSRSNEASGVCGV